MLLNSPVGRFGLLAMSDFEEIVQVGYQHAIEQLKDWKLPLEESASNN
jgi:hypothetical protein